MNMTKLYILATPKKGAENALYRKRGKKKWPEAAWIKGLHHFTIDPKTAPKQPQNSQKQAIRAAGGKTLEAAWIQALRLFSTRFLYPQILQSLKKGWRHLRHHKKGRPHPDIPDTIKRGQYPEISKTIKRSRNQTTGNTGNGEKGEEKAGFKMSRCIHMTPTK